MIMQSIMREAMPLSPCYLPLYTIVNKNTKNKNIATNYVPGTKGN